MKALLLLVRMRVLNEAVKFMKIIFGFQIISTTTYTWGKWAYEEVLSRLNDA